MTQTQLYSNIDANWPGHAARQYVRGTTSSHDSTYKYSRRSIIRMFDNRNLSINQTKGRKQNLLISPNLQFDNLKSSIIWMQVWQRKCSDYRVSTVHMLEYERTNAPGRWCMVGGAKVEGFSTSFFPSFPPSLLWPRSNHGQIECQVDSIRRLRFLGRCYCYTPYDVTPLISKIFSMLLLKWEPIASNSKSLKISQI